jgi:two-component system chemotaxis response regulator CheY
MKKILVIDDDPICLTILSDCLVELGYAVEQAHSGEQAWAALEEKPQDFQLVIVDRMMLGLDGMALLMRIKNTAQLKHIPVIMQTGESEKDEHCAAIKAGAADYLYKPLDRTLLFHLLKRLL